MIRQETLHNQPQLDVMTRENLLVLLQASGKKIEDCEGECEVDTGKRIGADLIVRGKSRRWGRGSRSACGYTRRRLGA